MTLCAFSRPENAPHIGCIAGPDKTNAPAWAGCPYGACEFHCRKFHAPDGHRDCIGADRASKERQEAFEAGAKAERERIAQHFDAIEAEYAEAAARATENNWPRTLQWKQYGQSFNEYAAAEIRAFGIRS